MTVNSSPLHSILLVDFYWTRPKDPRVPLGHASLLASLCAAGIPVVALALAVNDVEGRVDYAVEEILAAAAQVGPDCTLAIGAYVWAENLIRAVLPRLRRAGLAGPIILGGPQISHVGAGVERLYPEADGFIRGYGEQVLVELAQRPGRPQLEGVHWRGERDLVKQAPVDLSALPSPFLTGIIDLENQDFVRWETQRGCPFMCSFCQHREAGAKLRDQLLLPDRIMREIDLFCSSAVNDIAVLDPIFNANPHAVAVLERFAEQNYQGRLALQCRAEMTKADFLDAAARLHSKLEFGLQTADAAEGMAIRRPNRLDLVDKALAGCRERGIHHEVSLIFGLPLQTLASFERTVQWCLERQAPVIKAFPLELLRGTPLDRDRQRWALRDDGSQLAKVVQSDSMSSSDWQRMHQLADALALTEDHHPPTLDGLRALACDLPPPPLPRWALAA